jgi:hypothetical protein
LRRGARDSHSVWGLYVEIGPSTVFHLRRLLFVGCCEDRLLHSPQVVGVRDIFRRMSARIVLFIGGGSVRSVCTCI